MKSLSVILTLLLLFVAEKLAVFLKHAGALPVEKMAAPAGDLARPDPESPSILFLATNLEAPSQLSHRMTLSSFQL